MQQEKKKPLEVAAKGLVKGISYVPVFTGQFMEEFTEPGGLGSSTVGSLVFIAGVVMSADGYWQMFGGLPLIGVFEDRWLGWEWLPGFKLIPPNFYLGVLSNGNFWIAIGFSCVTQILQSYFFNGDAKNLAAKAKLNPKVVGFIAIATFTLEIIMTFSARNPLRYTDPITVLQCTLYNLLSIVSAELGRTVYKIMKAGTN